MSGSQSVRVTGAPVDVCAESFAASPPFPCPGRGGRSPALRGRAPASSARVPLADRPDGDLYSNPTVAEPAAFGAIRWLGPEMPCDCSLSGLGSVGSPRSAELGERSLGAGGQRGILEGLVDDGTLLTRW